MVCGAAGEPCVKGSSGLGHGAQGWSRLVFRLLVPKWQQQIWTSELPSRTSCLTRHLIQPIRLESSGAAAASVPGPIV